MTIWFAAAAVLVAADAYVCLVNVRNLIDHSNRVSRARDVIAAADDVLSTLREAESSERGYLLTGRVAYRERCASAGRRIEGEIVRLSGMVEDQPEEKERVGTLNTLVVDRIGDLTATMAAFERGGLAAALTVINTNAVKGAMDRARDLAEEIRQTEQRTLEHRTAERDRSAAVATTTLVGSGVLNLILLGLTVLAVRRDAAARARSADERVQKLALERDNVRLASEIDERRRHHEVLRALTDRLEQSNRELQDFASVASHDLQEPLRKIQAFGDRLRRRFAEPLGETGRDYVDRMHAAASRMQTLINDLLAFSRVTTRAQPFGPVDLGAIVRDVLSDLETRLEQSGGRVEVGPLPTVDADALQMRQLFQNLIANALKFRKPDVPPVVLVSASPAEADGAAEAFEIRVADNGIGFNEKYLDRIFNVFQRLHGRDQFEGTGIGLAVCRKIVERHGGTITAHSREGEGATFVVTLPAQPAEAGAAATATPATAEGDESHVAGTPIDHDLARR